MMITIALFTVFTAAFGASVLSLADTLVRGRNAYAELKAEQVKTQRPVPCRVIRPASFHQNAQGGSAPSLKFAA